MDSLENKTKVKFGINKTIYFILMILPMIESIMIMQFLSDQIPAHYNAAGQVDRYGSRYETLIIPVVVILFGAFMLLMANVVKKTEENGNRNNEKVMMIAGLSSLGVFNVLNVYFLYTGLKGIENLNDVPVNLEKLVFSILGLVMIVLGNLMPKCKRNHIIGVRTKWSLSSDYVWKKSQRFGGITFIVSGLMIIVGNTFLIDSNAGFAFTILIICIDGFLSIIYSYIIYKKEKQDKQEKQDK